MQKGDDDMSVSIRMNEEERNPAENHAEENGFLASESTKPSLFEKIEDECDRALYDEAYGEYLKSGRKSRPVEELFKELNV